MDTSYTVPRCGNILDRSMQSRISSTVILLVVGIAAIAAMSHIAHWVNGNVLDSRTHRQNVAHRLNGSYRAFINSPVENADNLDDIEGACDSSFRFERIYAMSLIAQLPQQPTTSLAVLIKGLRSRDSFTRKSAAEALLEWKSGAKPATAELIRVVEEHYDESSGLYAAEALGAIGDSSPEVMACLNNAILRENSLAAEGARRALLLLEQPAR